MPCNSDYMEPSGKEKALQKTAILFKALLEYLGKKVPHELHKAAKDMYCSTDYVSDLCRVLTGLPAKTRDEILNRNELHAAKLKVWWLRHNIADAARIEEANLEAQRAAKVRAALKKLNKEDREVLGLSN